MSLPVKNSVQISGKTLNRIRDYVARHNLAGRPTTVDQVVEQALCGELRVPDASQETVKVDVETPELVDCHEVIAVRIARCRKERAR